MRRPVPTKESALANAWFVVEQTLRRAKDNFTAAAEKAEATLRKTVA